MHFKDKVVWITGASSGIGEMLALKLSLTGAKLILTARNITALNALKQQCLLKTSYCEILPADLSLSETLETLTSKAINIYGHIDIVIHSAGVTQRSLAIDTQMKVYRQLMEINFFAPIAITQLLLPHFAARKAGHVVSISSMAGLMGFPLRTGYAAAKHALKGYFETLQVEHSIPGFNITMISPGRIHTPISLSALTANGTAHSKMDTGQLHGIKVEQCADKILSGIIHKKKHIIIARGERILWWLWFLIPGLYYTIARKKGLEV